MAIKGFPIWLVVVLASGILKAAPAVETANILWSRDFGRPFPVGMQNKPAIIKTRNGGFAVVSQEQDSSPTMMRSVTICSGKLTLLDSLGNVSAEKYYAAKSFNILTSLIQSPDGGYTLAGFATMTGDKSNDILLVKTDANGVSLWIKTFGENAVKQGYALIRTSDDGYAVAGDIDREGLGQTDFFLMRISAEGELKWSRSFGGRLRDECRALAQMPDGGFLLAGTTQSFGAGDSDFWVVRTNAAGDSLWSQTFGDIDDDRCEGMVKTSNGFALIGITRPDLTSPRELFLVIVQDRPDKAIELGLGPQRNDSHPAITLAPDGGFLLAGTQSPSTSSVYNGLTVYKTSSQGELEWRRDINLENVEPATLSILNADDGCALLYRAHPSGADNVRHNRLVKLELPQKKDPYLTLPPDRGSVLCFLSGYNVYKTGEFDRGTSKSVVPGILELSRGIFRLKDIPQCAVYYFDSLEAILFHNLPAGFPDSIHANKDLWPYDLSVIAGVLSVVGVHGQGPSSSMFTPEVMPTPPYFYGNVRFQTVPLVDFVNWAMERRLKRQ